MPRQPYGVIPEPERPRRGTLIRLPGPPPGCRNYCIRTEAADLIIVTGPPGAGKSTVAKVLSGLFDPSALVAGDQFFAFIDRGYVAPWTTAAHRQNEIVVEAAAATAGRLAAGGYTVVYDGVIGPWFVEAFGAAAGLDTLHYVILLPPEQLCLERVRNRAGHGFGNLEAARHMYAEFARTQTDRRHVVDSTEDPASLASRLLQLVQAGSLRRRVRDRRCH